MPLKNHLFLLLLFILTSIPLYSSSYINPSLPNADGSIPLTCSSVPYPFGTVGIALPGFEIGCPEELDPLLSPPFLSISNEPYIIQEISLQGYINIFAGPIYTRCLGANGIWMESKGSGWINLDETPFALSYQYNILTVVGCNNLVSIRRQEEIQTAIRGCATFCGTHDTSLGDSCSGLGCCQAALPGTLKSFDLEVTRFSISNLTANFINCSAAFFAQRDDLKQNQSGFLFHDFNFSDPQSYDDYIIQLDWAIGNKSCEASIRSDIGSFACKKNSHCYNSPSMVGYLCNCSQGYEGNPYAQEGCTDIDECQYTDVNPCIRYCINTEGSFTCGCPSGMTGDGRKDGSGCKKPFPLGFVLGLSICIVILFLSSSLVYWAYQRRRQITTIKEKYFRQYGGHLLLEKMKSEQGFSFRIFKEQELKEATDHFNSKNVVGEGGNGTVYRGTINNKEVAIK
ncbi:wall-associated receptor kinase 17-like [Carex rostrata]